LQVRGRDYIDAVDIVQQRTSVYHSVSSH